MRGSAGLIRPAIRDDVPAVHRMICELADYERGLDQVTATGQDLADALFGDRPALYAHVAQEGTEAVGFVLWFLNYSTWVGKHGIYIEDLYVDPRWRRKGIATALLAELARICIARGYGRLEWWVLNWNKPAWDFYASLGAQAMQEWTTHRLTGPALRALAAGPDDAP